MANGKFTIANGETISDAMDIGHYRLVGLEIPSEFDGTTLTFQAARQVDGAAGTYYAVKSANGATYTVTTAASSMVQLSSDDFLGARYVKVVAGTSQTGATNIQPIYSRGR